MIHPFKYASVYLIPVLLVDKYKTDKNLRKMFISIVLHQICFHPKQSNYSIKFRFKIQGNHVMFYALQIMKTS